MPRPQLSGGSGNFRINRVYRESQDLQAVLNIFHSSCATQPRLHYHLGESRRGQKHHFAGVTQLLVALGASDVENVLVFEQRNDRPSVEDGQSHSFRNSSKYPGGYNP